VSAPAGFDRALKSELERAPRPIFKPSLSLSFSISFSFSFDSDFDFGLMNSTFADHVEVVGHKVRRRIERDLEEETSR
jgi:hypothetical protein